MTLKAEAFVLTGGDVGTCPAVFRKDRLPRQWARKHMSHTGQAQATAQGSMESQVEQVCLPGG